jgi:hypothetical protein
VDIIDIGHYLEAGRVPQDVPAPAWRFAAYLGALIEAATVNPAGETVATPLPCRRRPGRRPCPGRMQVRRLEVPAHIEWTCPSCAEGGVIHGWAGTLWDLSPVPTSGHAEVRILLDEDAYRALRGVRVLDREAQRVIATARLTDRGVLIAAPADDVEHLSGFVAADANHEGNRRRARGLDELFGHLEAALQRE